MAVRSILALALALASVLAALSFTNAFFFPVPAPGGVGLSCGDGLLGELDFTPARLILCVSERSGVPLSRFRHTQTALETVFGLLGVVVDVTDSNSAAFQESFFVATNEAWVEVARILRVRLCNHQLPLCPSSTHATHTHIYTRIHSRAHTHTSVIHYSLYIITHNIRG